MQCELSESESARKPNKAKFNKPTFHSNISKNEFVRKISGSPVVNELLHPCVGWADFTQNQPFSIIVQRGEAEYIVSW
jgi:hypothetical protein